MKVLVLGAGKMVEAILEGLKNESDLAQFYLYSASGKTAAALAQKVGANFVEDLSTVVKPDWVWIGCKPQQLKELALKVKGHFPQATYVSMLAALPEADQREILGVQKLIRIMPNLPVRFKKGITLISSTSAPQELKSVKSLFATMGLAHEVSEQELEELTLLTGSGPALFYEFTKILSESFTSLNASDREDLARMVLQGSAHSAAQSNNSLEQLIGSVTSKGGVTIAVLEEWRRLEMKKLILDGVAHGKKRTTEIKESLRRS